MASLNKIFLIGNLTRDPEIRHTGTGKTVANIGIAVNRAWSDETGEKRDEVSFFNVTLWTRLAEIAEQYLKKGSPVCIEARLQTSNWEQAGQKRSELRIVGENMQLLPSRDRGTSSTAPVASPPPRSQPPPVVDPPLDINF